MFLEQLINGVTLGSIYAIVALGYTLVFGVLDIINMAHGALYMLGAVFSWYVVEWTGNYWLALLVAAAAGAALMLALDASFVLKGPKAERVVKADEFFLGLYSTLLGPDEILTQIRIPIPAAGSGWSYCKLKRKTGDFATADMARRLVDGDGSLDGFGRGGLFHGYSISSLEEQFT